MKILNKLKEYYYKIVSKELDYVFYDKYKINIILEDGREFTELTNYTILSKEGILRQYVKDKYYYENNTLHNNVKEATLKLIDSKKYYYNRKKWECCPYYETKESIKNQNEKYKNLIKYIE